MCFAWHCARARLGWTLGTFSVLLWPGAGAVTDTVCWTRWLDSTLWEAFSHDNCVTLSATIPQGTTSDSCVGQRLQTSGSWVAAALSPALSCWCSLLELLETFPVAGGRAPSRERGRCGSWEIPVGTQALAAGPRSRPLGGSRRVGDVEGAARPRPGQPQRPERERRAERGRARRQAARKRRRGPACPRSLACVAWLLLGEEASGVGAGGRGQPLGKRKALEQVCLRRALGQAAALAAAHHARPLTMAAPRTLRSLERDCEAMTLQQPTPALRGGAPPALYIHSMPAWVLEDFCQKMDCLSDYDWMRFASYVITDQTELRKIKCMEKTGISITRELMWWWGVRLATVQQLLDLLQGLQLYRAAQVILDWTSASSSTSSENEELVEPSKQERMSLMATEIKKRERESELSLLPSAGTLLPGAPAAGVAGAVAEGALCSLPSPPPPPRDLLNSLQSNPPFSSSVKPCSSPSPQQETMMELPSGSLLWTQKEVAGATSSFSEESRIGEGAFADVYKGQRNNVVYAIKRLKETECTSPSATQRFFHTEVQICFRCCHVNILQLLGFSIETGLHCLIYPYLPNGSLQNKLHAQDSSAPLPWEARVSIAAGLLRAVQYLHNFGILHGNIKSSNVLLDENLTPKLGHSGLRLLSADKKSEYAVMKTKVLQGSLTYLPEDVVRHGQLADRVDVFSCGVVLAEMLTGMKALDEGRHPAYLKDLIADEIQVAKESCCSKGKPFDKLAAKEICCKYLDTRAGHLLEEAAVDFASAICLCLRKKNPSIAEALGVLGTAEKRLREHCLCGGSTSGFSINTPEETDDETSSMSREMPSAGGSKEGSKQPLALSSAPPCLLLLAAVSPDTYCEQMSRVPCESDESSSFIWNPSDRSAEELPSSSCSTSEKAAASDAGVRQDKATNGLQQRSEACSRSEEAAAPSSIPADSTDLQPPCAQALPRETSWKIKINDQKRKLMENILLYEEDKLSSSELFDS